MPKQKKQVKKEAIKARRSLKARVAERRKQRQFDKAESLQRHNKLTSAFRIFKDSLSLTRQYWRLFLGIVVVYFLLSVVLVGGLSGNVNIEEIQQSLGQEVGKLSTTIALYGLLLGSTGSAGSETGAAYLSIVVIVVSLTTIWALRQLLGGEKVAVKQAFYKGMTPLVPFVLVLLVIGLTLLPALLGGTLFTAIYGGNLAVTMLEKVLWAVLVLGLFMWSLRLFSTYGFALYIVTLPDMQPVAALKAARKLVRFRRLIIIRKILFLPFTYLLISATVMIPLILFAPVLVQWVFVPLSLFGFVFAHVYLYSLYKEVL